MELIRESDLRKASVLDGKKLICIDDIVGLPI